MDLIPDEESDYRSSAMASLRRILKDRIRDRTDRHLEGMAVREESDWRNGYFSHRLLTELGDIPLNVLRTRTMSDVGVIQSYMSAGRESGPSDGLCRSLLESPRTARRRSLASRSRTVSHRRHGIF
jgi:hypothetical protein